MFFHHSIFRTSNFIFKHQDYELEASKLPEDILLHFLQATRKIAPNFRTFLKLKKEEFTSAFVEQWHFGEIFNEAAGTDECNMNVIGVRKSFGACE